ncbi:glycosyltransferase family 2 protein [Paracidobacterium acidisoli]|uniref:Glycosyltransferase family 2 protein n=1 Tax=Paracidobacterium acidisoli TaxID=2303751 RepID=A0A372IT26_9BACT|nr:glycosyltransferase family A protein [Paracidobacterium acidisoli]MBT9329483.1 glycosyltransferase family 2 protein [Paracidobacterium acidisoli]
MTQDRLITVGVPVYNAMPWLPESLDSILSQTFHDFDLLVIVDGATDDSLDYLESIDDSRLRILTQENSGVAQTLNRMLHEARTPWLVRHDADDVSYPLRLARIAEAIEQHPDAGMFYSFADYYPVHASAGRFRCSRGPAASLRSMAERGYVPSICHPSAALHIEKTLRIGGYRLDLPAEDADLWWRMALAWDIHCIPEPLVGFRHNGASVSTRRFHMQETAGLYVQYLLLSHLWNLVPQSFCIVEKELEKLADPAQRSAKYLLRSMNLRLSERQPLRAAAAFLKALAASPSYVAGRVRDEIFPGTIVNGISPELFLQRKDILWAD